MKKLLDPDYLCSLVVMDQSLATTDTIVASILVTMNFLLIALLHRINLEHSYPPPPHTHQSILVKNLTGLKVLVTQRYKINTLSLYTLSYLLGDTFIF